MEDIPKISEHLQTKLKTLPEKPGVYRYFDEDGEVIYVGKAKNLKKRVSSYFHKQHDSGRLRLLVRKIVTFETIVVKTEFEALLLENSLIKELQPRYNVMLKDDKTYPWICIKKEPFPRVFQTRNNSDNSSEYFGPYPSVRTLRTMMDMIHGIFPLRNCKLNLIQSNIEAGKFRVCLEYHLKNCMGPCVGEQSTEEYEENIQSIRQILRGQTDIVIKKAKAAMLTEAGKLAFEKAQEWKEKLLMLEKFREKSTVVSPEIRNADVFNISCSDDLAFVSYFRVSNGAIIAGHTYEYKRRMEENEEEILLIALAEFYRDFGHFSEEIIFPVEVDLDLGKTRFTVPKRGIKKDLLDLAFKNALQAKGERLTQIEMVDPERRTNELMRQMAKDLRLPTEPRHIECFDNSNFQGTDAVAACVVFRNGKPAKKDYRHFNIKTVTGPDDFASMEEIVYRRYSRMLEEETPLPDLIVIDGGKGQLSAAVSALNKIGIYGKVPVVGIAKRLEEIYYPNDELPIYIDKKSQTLRVIQHIRDEAHRFGITHHRNKRSKNFVKTSLTDLSGIGEKTAIKLLQHYGSLEKLYQAGSKDVAIHFGQTIASKIFGKQ